MREGRERQSRALDGSRLSAPMDWLKKALPKAEPPTPTAAAKAAPTAPPTPGAVSHKDVSSKELDELTTILKDSASLSALASAGLEAGTLISAEAPLPPGSLLYVPLREAVELEAVATALSL